MTRYLEFDGLRLAYDDVGEGEPVVLLHGFSADRRFNWKLPGWYDALTRADFANVGTPALVACGGTHTLSGSPIPLAASIPGARAVVIPGRSHVGAVADPFFKGAVLGFLGCHR